MGEPAPDAHRRASLLLTGGIVVTMDDDRRVLDGGVVAVRENRIVAVGRAADLAGWTADEVVDCRAKAVLPGFVDGHTHLYQSLVRGLGEGLSIVPWLREFMWPYSIALSAQDAVAGARLGALEAVRSGITTVVDHHYAQTDVATTLAVADAIEQAGLRGAVARGMVGERSEIAARRGQPPALFRYGLADEVAITAEAMQHRPSGSRVEIWPAPIN
nr:amidohydrolase family protein [Pseudonocardiales bacterium]